jgi:hypothetical protein
MPGAEALPIGMHFEVDVGPVVQSRAAQVAILEGEAQRADQVEARGGGGAKPRRGSGVLWNLRRDEDDVKIGLSGHRAGIRGRPPER